MLDTGYWILDELNFRGKIKEMVMMYQNFSSSLVKMTMKMGCRMQPLGGGV